MLDSLTLDMWFNGSVGYVTGNDRGFKMKRRIGIIVRSVTIFTPKMCKMMRDPFLLCTSDGSIALFGCNCSDFQLSVFGMLV